MPRAAVSVSVKAESVYITDEGAALGNRVEGERR